MHQLREITCVLFSKYKSNILLWATKELAILISKLQYYACLAGTKCTECYLIMHISTFNLNLITDYRFLDPNFLTFFQTNNSFFQTQGFQIGDQ